MFQRSLHYSSVTGRLSLFSSMNCLTTSAASDLFMLLKCSSSSSTDLPIFSKYFSTCRVGFSLVSISKIWSLNPSLVASSRQSLPFWSCESSRRDIFRLNPHGSEFSLSSSPEESNCLLPGGADCWNGLVRSMLAFFGANSDWERVRGCSGGSSMGLWAGNAGTVNSGWDGWRGMKAYSLCSRQIKVLNQNISTTCHENWQYYDFEVLVWQIIH